MDKLRVLEVHPWNYEKVDKILIRVCEWSESPLFAHGDLHSTHSLIQNYHTLLHSSLLHAAVRFHPAPRLTSEKENNWHMQFSLRSTHMPCSLCAEEKKDSWWWTYGAYIQYNIAHTYCRAYPNWMAILHFSVSKYIILVELKHFRIEASRGWSLSERK